MVASENVVMPFGKHRGKTLGYIADVDLLYLDWLNDEDITRNPTLLLAVADICNGRRHQIASMLDERESARA